MSRLDELIGMAKSARERAKQRDLDLRNDPKNASLFLTAASLHRAADEMERLVEVERNISAVNEASSTANH